MALKMTATEPNASSPISREASANITNPRIEAVNLITSAAALPLITLDAMTCCSELLTMLLRGRPRTVRPAYRSFRLAGKAQTTILVYAAIAAAERHAAER